jgi:glycosyltransferase involved in cell wall biosynthesis
MCAIIPAYNYQQFIEQATDFILAHALVSKVFSLDKNCGAATARNKGLKLAHVDAIASLDADC